MKCIKLVFAAPVLLGLSAAQAHAGGLKIVASYESSITSDPNALLIENSIQDAINVYEANFVNPVQVNIDFQAGGGLGTSETTIYSGISYDTYRAALIATKALGTDDTAFLSSLPASGNPVPGNSASTVEDTSAGLRALGLNYSGGVTVNGTNYDSQITLNTSIMNLSRTGPQDASKFDIQAVVSHEIDEVLGFNSALDAGFPANNVGPADFFRYNGVNSRSFTTSTSEAAYFSIDGGQTPIVYFNQGSTGDRHDWASSGEPYASSTHRVQDAFGTPGIDINLGPAEYTGLSVIGYNRSNISAAPEPSPLAGLGFSVFGALGLILRARKRKVSLSL